MLFGLPDQSFKLSKYELQFLSYGLLTAKKLILTFWRKQQASLQVWLSELTNILHLEEIRFSLRDKRHHFDRIWAPFVSYLEVNT